MSTIKKYSLRRDGGKSITKNFKVREFACKDGSDKILIDHNMVNYAQIARYYFGGAGNINSAYRHLLYNRSVGSDDNSRHIKGKAVDIWYVTKDGKKVPPKEVGAFFEFIGAGGVGVYPSFTHGDTRPIQVRWVNYGTEKVVPTHINSGYSLPVKDVRKVTASSLIIRRGPGTTYKRLGSLPRGSIVKITLIYGEWGKLDSKYGWVHLGYTEKEDGKLKKGDAVKVIGSGYASSFGTGRRTKDYKRTMYVVAYHEGRKAPYQLSVYKHLPWTTGFFREDQVSRIVT